MVKLFYRILARLTGKNLQSTPKALVLDQLSEMRPLPMGMQEFEDWSDRIISGALMTADPLSLKFALAEMIMHMDPKEDHCNDGYFIKKLRKSAANQIAHAKMTEIRDRAKARLAEQEAKEKEVKPTLQVVSEGTGNAQVLADNTVQKA
jgi:hypothetical protein